MFDKDTVLTCFKSLVGFKEDSNDIYATLYKQIQADATNTLTFASAAKTITGAGTIDFTEQEFEAGDSLIVTGTSSNNGTLTITDVTDTVITVSEALTDEASTTGLIKALSDIMKSTSGLWVNGLSSVSFEYIDANLTDDLTAKQYLENVYEDSVLDILNQFVNRSKQDYNSKELLSKQNIAKGVASMNDRVTQNKRFVGWWLRVNDSNYLKVQISHLGMQTTEIQSDLKIYVYETSQLEPVKTFTFNASKELSLVWQEISDCILQHQSDSTGTGQDYLVGYYEKDPDNAKSYQLQGEALYMDFTCTGCGKQPNKIYDKYLIARPIEINHQDLNFDSGDDEYNIPQVDNVADYVTNQTYGLLLKINVYCDITEVLCYNKDLFAKALQHAVAVRILHDAYASNRINDISDSKREQVKQFAVKYDSILNGYNNPDGVFIKGLLSTLSVDFSALDSHCLPCKPGILMGRLKRS